MVAHMVENKGITNVPVIVLNVFPGLIGDSIMSMPSTLGFGDIHIIEHKSISWDGSLFLEDETSHLFHGCFMCMCALLHEASEWT